MSTEPEMMSALVAAGSALLGTVVGGFVSYLTARQSNFHQAQQSRITRDLAQLEKLNEILAAITKHLSEVESAHGAVIAVPELASFPRAKLLADVYLPEAKSELQQIIKNYPTSEDLSALFTRKAHEVRRLTNEIDKKIVQRCIELSASNK